MPRGCTFALARDGFTFEYFLRHSIVEIYSADRKVTGSGMHDQRGESWLAFRITA